MNESPGESEPLLCIALITFNRAAKLDRTLGSLARSCFATFPITIYDNASTDETPFVIDRYRLIFPKFEVIRHARNIGAGGNVIRAYGGAGGRYFWVICDDDYLDPGYGAEVIHELGHGGIDLVLINAMNLEGFEPEFRGSLHDVERKGWRFCWLAGFVPSSIYRTSLITSAVIQRMLAHSVHYYPHVALIAACLEANACVYIANPALLRREDSRDIGTDWVAFTYGWVRSLEDCPESATRCMAFWHRFAPDENWWWITVKSAAYMLAFKEERRTQVLQMWLNLPAVARLLSCPIVILLLLPRWVLRFVGARMKPAAKFVPERVLAG